MSTVVNYIAFYDSKKVIEKRHYPATMTTGAIVTNIHGEKIETQDSSLPTGAHRIQIIRSAKKPLEYRVPWGAVRFRIGYEEIK